MPKRIGFIGMVIDNPRELTSNNTIEKINALISQYSHLVMGRMGVPRHEEKVSVIVLIIEGTTDEIGAMTGKIGSLAGVTVKSALTKKNIANRRITNGEDEKND